MRAGFRSELAQVTCPIGVSGITGKEPEVIAVVRVAAQLLQRLGQTCNPLREIPVSARELAAKTAYT